MAARDAAVAEAQRDERDNAIAAGRRDHRLVFAGDESAGAHEAGDDGLVFAGDDADDAFDEEDAPAESADLLAALVGGGEDDRDVPAHGAEDVGTLLAGRRRAGEECDLAGDGAFAGRGRRERHGRRGGRPAEHADLLAALVLGRVEEAAYAASWAGSGPQGE